MFAQVIPLKRVPRILGILTYHVPVNLEHDIVVGQLILVPLRQHSIFAIVVALSDEAPPKADTAKSIDSIAIGNALWSATDIKRMRDLADMHLVPLSTVALLASPPLQKRKLNKQSVLPLQQIDKKSSGSETIVDVYSSEEERRQLIDRHSSGYTVILVPEQQHIQQIYNLLPPEKKGKTIIWHSKLSIKEQYEKWFQVRNGEAQVVIGTRSSVFLPWQKIDTIIIDLETDEQHKSWDQYPRYDARDIAKQLQVDFGAKIVRISSAAGLESYYRVHKGEWFWGKNNCEIPTTIPSPLASSILRITTRPGIHIVDMRQERRAKNFAFFAEEVSTAIASQTRDVYIFVPRRGFATSVGCHDCGYSFQCKKCERALIYHDDTRTLRCHYCSIAEPMTLSCPRCHSVVVDMRGGGTELVEKTVQMLLSQKNTHEIIRIDGDTDEVNLSSTTKPKIIIGTQRAIPLVDWANTNLVILTGLDDILGLPELHATENVWYNTLDVLYHRQESSQIYIQTYHTEHVVFKSLTEPDRWYRTELNIRKQFSYPPYSDQLIRYIVSAPDIKTAEKLGIELQHELEQKLTISKIFAKIDGPITMSPAIYRGLYRFVLIGRYEGADWQNVLSTLHSSLITPCTIDPSPITLLSP